MPDSPTAVAEETLICPSCLQSISARQHFCEQCNAPLTSFAATDPIARIRTEAEVVRRAFQHPHLLGLWGVWLIFGPITVATMAYSVLGFRQMFPLRTTSEFIIAAVYAVMSLGWIALFGAILWRMTHRYLTAALQIETQTSVDDDPFEGEWPSN